MAAASLGTTGSPFNALKSAMHAPAAPGAKPFVTPPTDDPLARQAAYAEAEGIRDLKKAKHDLFTVKLPISGIMGTMVYLLYSSTDKTSRIVKDFGRLLSAQQSIRDEIGRLFEETIRSGQQLPPELNEALTQLRDSLKKGNAPHHSLAYMHQVRQAGAGQIFTGTLDIHLQEYMNSAERIFANPKGLKAMAAEPLILKRLGMSKRSAQNLAMHDRQAFMETLFRNVMSNKEVDNLQKVFMRLTQVHGRIARLLALGVSAVLGGYFIIDNELKSNRIIKRAT